MKKQIGAVLLMLLFIPNVISAESAENIVLSEVQVTGGSGYSTDEFVELYNPTGTAVSLAGWSLTKKTASGTEYTLVDDFGSMSIAAHSFFLVAHPTGYQGSVSADIRYSSGSSIADNNTVVLTNADGQPVDMVGLGSASVFEGAAAPNPGPLKSLERKAFQDSETEDMQEGGRHSLAGNGEDSGDNSRDFILRSIPDPQNAEADSESPDMILDEEVPDDSEASEEAPEPAEDYPATIRINELFPNPEGSDDAEFIELYNAGKQDIDLEHWQIGDESSRRYTIRSGDFNSTIIRAKGYFVIEKEQSGVSLNNTGDTVYVYYPNEEEAAWADCPRGDEGVSYSRIDGDWHWTDAVTPGADNELVINNALPVAQFELEQTEVKAGQVLLLDGSASSDPDGDNLDYVWDFGDGEAAEGDIVEHGFETAGTFTIVLRVVDEKGGEDEWEEVVVVSEYDFSSEVVLSELLPSCEPTDKECEFIELFNPSNRPLDLEGWQLTDQKTAYTIERGRKIGPGDYLVFERAETGVTLNNSGDTVFLINPVGDIVSGVTFEKASKNNSFALSPDGTAWRWTKRLTPGALNIFPEEAIDEERDGPEFTDTKQQVETASVDADVVLDVAIQDVSEALLGRKLRVTGDVDRANSRGIYLMDGAGNVLRVYVQKSTGINQPELNPGDRLTVTGVLDKTSAGLRLLPRTLDDFEIQKATSPSTSSDSGGVVLGAHTQKEQEATVVSVPPNTSNQQVIWALVSVIIVCVGLVGFLYWKMLALKKAKKAD